MVARKLLIQNTKRQFSGDCAASARSYTRNFILNFPLSGELGRSIYRCIVIWEYGRQFHEIFSQQLATNLNPKSAQSSGRPTYAVIRYAALKRSTFVKKLHRVFLDT